MLKRTESLPRHAGLSWRPALVKPLSFAAASPPKKTSTRTLRALGVACLGLGIAFLYDTRPTSREPAGRRFTDPLEALSADALNESNLHLINKPFGYLVTAYITYTSLSSGLLISCTSSALTAIESMRSVLPFGLGEALWRCADFVLRRTAFRLFAGGEDAMDTYPLLNELAEEGTSGLLCYSAEADTVSPNDASDTALVQANVDEILKAIEAAGSFPTSSLPRDLRPTWVAIKLTGLVRDPGVLRRASEALVSSSAFQRGQRLSENMLFPPSPLLSTQDEMALSALQESLMRCGQSASRLGVRCDIDAEQSWFQPAIDRYYELLAEACNKRERPIIFQTYQTYRQDARERLHSDWDRARALGLSFGAKLVRGAYVESETFRAAQQKRPSPLWSTKFETDTCYNACAADMADAIARDIEQGATTQSCAMFASHNSVSTRLVLERFRHAGLMRDHVDRLIVDERLRGRIVFGQLLGMADNLTAELTKLLGPGMTLDPDPRKHVELLPYVLKYIPYGQLEKVLPYLIRRAQENKAMLAGDNSRGGVRHERKAVGREIRRRLVFPKVA